MPLDSVQPESAGLSDAGMVLGGVALSAIFLLAAFIAFDCLRELNQSDAEAEKERERERRGVVRQKSFRGWAIVGILMCLLVMKHVHHLSTAPMMSEEEVARVLADPASHPVGEIFNAHPAFKGDEKKVKAALEKHLDNNPHLTQPRPMAEAKEEHLLAGGVAAAFIMFLLAYLVIDFLREFNRKSHLGQTEQDKRAALRCWALLGIIICCVIVKQLHHAHTNEATDELDDLHASKYAPEKVGGVVPEGAQWIEEHGVMRVKQASDEVTGDVRTCAYEKQRCMCEGHVRYGDGDSWTDWRDVEESIMCTNDAFGTDPAPHKVKVCQCRPEIRKCADEGEMCACEGGRVRYGKGDSWTEWEDMEELVKAYPNDVSSDKILCENNVFGDPAKGQVKICECEESLPEEGIESPNGLEPGDDILDDKYLKEGAAKVQEDEATAARAAASTQTKNPGGRREAAAKPDTPTQTTNNAAGTASTKPKAFLSAGEKFKAERAKMKAGLGK